MRSSLIARLLLVVVLAAVIGLPGIRQLEPVAVGAQTPDPGTRQPMPPGDVWTGEVPGASTDGQSAPSTTVPGTSAGGNIDSAAVGASGGATDGSAVSGGTTAGPEQRTTPSARAASRTEPLIVRFKPGATRSVQVDAHVAAGAQTARSVALTDTVVVDVPAGQGQAALAAYNARPDVLYAEPDYQVHAFYTPNDPQYSNQYALPKVDAPSAWDTTRGNSVVRVAVVDCGVFSQQTGRNYSDGQAGHPDLRGRVILNQDFTSSATGFDDYCDHGTHVAGIVGAAGNNGIGVSGLAPQVSLMNAKVLSDSGSGYTSNILNGVSWAVQNGAHVVNMSLGRSGGCSQSEADMMNYAWSQGVVVVAAAGNSSASASGAPANCPNVISVASTTSSDQLSSFSNYGANVDVAAPGSSILSTVRSGGYAYYSGTSMASPYVAGLAGLVFSLNPNASAQSVLDAIRTTATQISGTGSQFAWGRINAAGAVGAGTGPAPTGTATQPSVPTQTPTPTVTVVPTATQTTCPSPRPQIQVTTTPAGGPNFDVVIVAGAGVLRQVDFRQLRNASVTIGSQTGVTQPFVYRPNPPVNQLGFRLTQRSYGQSATVTLTITDDCGAWTTFVGSGAGGFRRGSVSGTIRSAADSQPIEGATVSVRGTQRSMQTDSSGAYILTDVPIGNRTVDVNAAGFAGKSVPVYVQENQTATANVNLTPTGSQQDIVVSLTWGQYPQDLDIHLSGPSVSGNRFHLYWYNPGAVSHAELSQDRHFGYGPEAVTIRRSDYSGNWVPGEYRIWAHNYSGTPGYGSSSGRVTVTRGDTELGSYDASAASGSSSQLIWRSVNLTVDASGNVSLSPVQAFASGNSSSVFRFQDGSDELEWPLTGKP
ncbi:MAG: S8 family serine peptidase [Chloroflexota bacterium]